MEVEKHHTGALKCEEKYSCDKLLEIETQVVFGGYYVGAALEEYSMLDPLLKARRTQEDVNRGRSSTRWQTQCEKGDTEERYCT